MNNNPKTTNDEQILNALNAIAVYLDALGFCNHYTNQNKIGIGEKVAIELMDGFKELNRNINMGFNRLAKSNERIAKALESSVSPSNKKWQRWTPVQFEAISPDQLDDKQ